MERAGVGPWRARRGQKPEGDESGLVHGGREGVRRVAGIYSGGPVLYDTK